MKSKVLVSLILPLTLVALTSCNISPEERTATRSVMSGSVDLKKVDEVKNLPSLEELEKEGKSVDIMLEPEVSKKEEVKEEKVAKVLESTLAVESIQPQKKEVVNVIKEEKVQPAKVEGKINEVKKEERREVKQQVKEELSKPVLRAAPTTQAVAVQHIAKPVEKSVKTEKQTKKEEKSVTLNPEETVIVNGSVVKKNANEDYRDLAEEAMIDAVLNSTSGFEGRDVEVNTTPEKVEPVKVVSAEVVEKVVENKSTLQQEEEQLDALLSAGKNNEESHDNDNDLDCPVEDMGNGEYKVSTNLIVNPVVEYDYSSLEE